MPFLSDISKTTEGQKTAFGELSIAELTPVVQLQFPYNINSLMVDSRANQSGSVSVADNMAQISSGAASNSSGQLTSHVPIKYNPGQGGLCRFTALFTTGVANSFQLAGIGDSGDGYFFGYNGSAFSILKRQGGMPEVRTLTVSTASSDAENITITLDGDALATVAVTASGVITTTVNEIAAADYSDVGRGWTAEAVGDTVVFYSWDSFSRTGSYTLSGATSAVGAFAQTLAGVAPTDTYIAQSAWNGDKFDGTGDSGVTLDPTKGNVYQIQYQWLGFGAIDFLVEDALDGRFKLAHRIEYANANVVPSVDNPTLPLCAMSENVSNTSDLVVKTGSMAGFVEGKQVLLGPRRGASGKEIALTTTPLPVLSIRNNRIYQSKLNRTKVKINFVSISVEHTKPVIVSFYENATLIGASWSDVDASTSVMQVDTTATAVTGGVFLFALDLGKTGSQIIDFRSSLEAVLVLPGNHLSAVAVASSGNNAEVDISFNWIEEF